MANSSETLIADLDKGGKEDDYYSDVGSETFSDISDSGDYKKIQKNNNIKILVLLLFFFVSMILVSNKTVIGHLVHAVPLKFQPFPTSGMTMSVSLLCTLIFFGLYKLL